MSAHSLNVVQSRWTPPQRLGFRVAFSYLLIYAFASGNDNLLYVIPKLGAQIASWLKLVWQKPAVWLAQHHFHITGVGANIHATGSGDTAINWIGIGIMLVYSLFVAFLWSILDRHRAEYHTASVWLRFLLRLTLVIAMANYGFSKLFPMQMPPPSLAVLNEPIGNASPMTVLWTFVGLNPVYEMICGAAEVAAAILLFFRRTALAGALLTCFVMSNVLLYDLFFDVPVKIYAAHLVLFSLLLVVPDFSALWNFFWRQTPAAPSTLWAPASSRRSPRIAIRVLEIFVALMVLTSIPGHYRSFAQQLARSQNPHSLTGQWHVDSTPAAAGREAAFKSVATGNGLPVTDIFFEPNGRLTLRDSTGHLWRAGADIQDNSHSLILYRDIDAPISFNYFLPDSTHLILTPSDTTTTSTLHLTRVPLPSHYPLLDEHFHFINEWPRER